MYFCRFLVLSNKIISYDWYLVYQSWEQLASLGRTGEVLKKKVSAPQTQMIHKLSVHNTELYVGIVCPTVGGEFCSCVRLLI